MWSGCTPAANGGYPCPTVTEATTSAVGGSATSVTPGLAISGQGWQIGYSQNPWSADGYHAPRVVMGTVRGRGVSLSLGMAFPDCPMCAGNGAAIQDGQIVKLGVHGYGWGASAIWVGGGSMGTINKLLQEWRGAHERRTAVDLALPPALKRALLDFMQGEIAAAKV